VTSLPDWLVERAALDEVAPVHRERLDRADPRELAERIAALRAANAAELAGHPTDPAIAMIEARVANAAKRQTERRRLHRVVAVLGVATTAAVLLLVLHAAVDRPEDPRQIARHTQYDERVKGLPRLVVFRQAGQRAERLDPDAVVRPGEILQLRYNPGGQAYGLIASVDGAGVVTLHFPATEDAPTAIAQVTTALPSAYALDDAPRFERFFFITANDPIDVAQTLAALRTLAKRADSRDATLELPESLHQWSLRLRKPE